MNRRAVLLGLPSLGTTPWLAGCTLNPPAPSGPFPTKIRDVVDAHCHLFNGRDLPTIRFLRQVVFKLYPKDGIRTLDIQDGDVLDGLLAILMVLVGRSRAPTAREEIAVLDGHAQALAANRNTPENEGVIIDGLAQVIQDDAIAVSGEITPKAYRTIRSEIFRAAGEEGAATSSAPLTEEEARAVAKKAYESKMELGILFRWFALFTRYRHVLAEQLADHHRREGFEATLLCPAMIDYDYWLDEFVDKSPLPDQVTVMGRLARRSTGPAVHGYVAFDPLRQARWTLEHEDGGSSPRGHKAQFDPLALVERAVKEEGFLGVKLYPPMGFKPLGNADDVCQLYPKRVLQDFGAAPSDPTTADCPKGKRPADGSTALSRRLDSAMISLFDLCSRVDVDASIIAHAGNSVQAGHDYGERADHAHWIPVFRRWPDLRVMLAHFGGFAYRSVGAPAGAQLPESSWEWTFGRYLKEAGDPPVFCDISYFTEVAHRTPAETEAYATLFKRWVDLFDQDCRHLVYGTDWLMLGLDDAYEGYTRRTFDFFERIFGKGAPQLDRLFTGNAARFLGLRDGDHARTRLLSFYARHNVPASRLPVFRGS